MTSKTRSFRPSPALIVASVALILALTGSAIAAGVAKNSVRSPQIVDGTVRTLDLRDDSVNAAKIAKDQVGADEIAENAVSSPEVAPDSLTAADLGPASVGSSEVTDQSLTANDLGPDSVGSSELQAGSVRASELGAIIQVSNATTIKTGDDASVAVGCPAGTTVISGGNTATSYRVALTGALRSGNGWLAHAHSYAAANETLTVFAYCLSGGSSN